MPNRLFASQFRTRLSFEIFGCGASEDLFLESIELVDAFCGVAVFLGIGNEFGFAMGWAGGRSTGRLAEVDAARGYPGIFSC